MSNNPSTAHENQVIESQNVDEKDAFIQLRTD